MNSTRKLLKVNHCSRELRNRDLHSKGIYIIPSPHDPLSTFGPVII
jgi:hypothetical protein